MAAPHVEPGTFFRRTVSITATHLELMLAAVLVSRLGLGRTMNTVVVMALTIGNAAIIAGPLLGVRRDRMIAMLALVTAIFVLGLLAWPAWDVYERVGY
jgi:ethanolamine utilization microcompartment shell protein EutS